MKCAVVPHCSQITETANVPKDFDERVHHDAVAHLLISGESWHLVKAQWGKICCEPPNYSFRLTIQHQIQPKRERNPKINTQVSVMQTERIAWCAWMLMHN